MAAFDNGLAARRRRSRARRAPVARRRRRGSPRPDARPHDARCADRSPIARRGRASSRGRVPTLAEVLARHRDVRVIVELKVNSDGSGPGGGRRRAPGGRRRSRLLRIVRTARAASGAGDRAGDRDQRGARRSAMGALPIVVPLAGDRASRTADIRCRSCAGAHARRVAALRPRRAPRRPRACRCGRWTRRKPRVACSTGEWTR